MISLSILLRGNLVKSRILSLKNCFHKKVIIPWIPNNLFHDVPAPIKSFSTERKNVYLLDETISNNDSITSANKFSQRTHTCGELRVTNVDQKVILCGWLEYQRMNKFVVIRDAYGQTQLLITDKDENTQKLVETLPYESIIKIRGIVAKRPADMVNKKQATGDIEVLVDEFTVLNIADNLPFHIRNFQKAKESLRMRYRYLDLRFDEMQRNLRVRSKMIMSMRDFLINKANFVDVETPTLFKATPGGAQEFVVPTRFPGQFYSLVQSPQQFKQMLMAGSIDRYFQIARCYRDEGSRPDRQPEFTQLDLELSFTTVDGILTLIEELLQHSWPAFLDPLPNSFKKITYRESMLTYGTDKPDLRFDYKLKKLKDNFLRNELVAYALVFNESYAILPKAIKENFQKLTKMYSKVKLIQNISQTFDEWLHSMKRVMNGDEARGLYQHLELKDNAVVFIACGDDAEVVQLLGKIRVEYVDYLEKNGNTIKKKGMYPLWIVDFPLFEKDNNVLQSAHHPFTAPHPDDLNLLSTEPLKVRALAYDLVLNGNEVGGGSIRIHDPVQQQFVFQLLGIETSTMQHMIDMLKSGCPPHGGIALGLDRLFSVILDTLSIRDVIAFPKTFEGRDPVSGAPAHISEDVKKLYHIETVLNK